MDLSSFPFDCQNLQICLKPYKLETEKLLLRPRRAESAIEEQDSHEWEVSPQKQKQYHLVVRIFDSRNMLSFLQIVGHFMKAFQTDPAASSTRKAYSTMFITVLVQRQSAWFVRNVFFLIFLLLAYCWFAFLLAPVRMRCVY